MKKKSGNDKIPLKQKKKNMAKKSELLGRVKIDRMRRMALAEAEKLIPHSQCGKDAYYLASQVLESLLTGNSSVETIQAQAYIKKAVNSAFKSLPRKKELKYELKMAQVSYEDLQNPNSIIKAKTNHPKSTKGNTSKNRIVRKQPASTSAGPITDKLVQDKTKIGNTFEWNIGTDKSFDISNGYTVFIPGEITGEIKNTQSFDAFRLVSKTKDKAIFVYYGTIKDGVGLNGSVNDKTEKSISLKQIYKPVKKIKSDNELVADAKDKLLKSHSQKNKEKYILEILERLLNMVASKHEADVVNNMANLLQSLHSAS